MSREAERWNIDLGVENRGLRKATLAGQPKEGSRMRLPEEVSKKREVTSSPVAEGSQRIDDCGGDYGARKLLVIRGHDIPRRRFRGGVSNHVFISFHVIIPVFALLV
jgi:hypothetical protein